LKLKLALIITSVILIGSLAANVYFYARYSFAANDVLQKQVDELERQAANLQSEKASLQNQLSQAEAPKIVTRLGVKDVRSSPAEGHPWSGRIRLYVAGEVWNAGTEAVQNCRLHVTFHQGEVMANDTYIELGTIAIGSWKDVAANIYYEGVALTNWTIIPEFGDNNLIP
jgi:cell division protein FtsL